METVRTNRDDYAGVGPRLLRDAACLKDLAGNSTFPSATAAAHAPGHAGTDEIALADLVTVQEAVTK